jgi:hypothetical protein
VQYCWFLQYLHCFSENRSLPEARLKLLNVLLIVVLSKVFVLANAKVILNASAGAKQPMGVVWLGVISRDGV